MTNLFYLPQCSSTQDEIEKYISAGPQPVVAVYTFHQTKGKGQYGNSWELQKDLNLAYSLAIAADRSTLPDYLFNFHTAEILADFLDTLTPLCAQIKWPNDVILKNKKVAGILIEKKMVKSRAYFIIGIGLNVLQTDFNGLSQAGSVLTQTGLHYDLKNLTERLHAYFMQHLAESTSVEEGIRKVNKRLFRKEAVSVFEIKQVRQNGIIRKVDDEGFLWVELENEGLKRFFHKEISLLY